jgi:hypothetical protein
MNEFIIKFDKILKNRPLPRHNTAADRELPQDLPEDLPQELWTAKCVWVRFCGQVPPLYGGPYLHPLAAQTPPLQAADERQGGQHLHLLPKVLHQRHLHPNGGVPSTQQAPAGATRRRPSASASSLHHRRQKLTLKNCFSWDACQVFSMPREGIIKLLPAMPLRDARLAVGHHLLCC